MHAVWRARQGIPWEPEQAKGMVANAGHISKVGAIGNFPAASPEDLTEAFGLRAAPKIVRAIDGSTAGPEKAALRKKAIAASMEMYRDAQQVVSLVAAGIVPALNKCCFKEEEPDATMRTAALVAMTRLGREYKAREQMLAHGTLKALTAASSDEADVSGACLSVVSELVKHREFSMPLVDAGFVKLLVSWPTAGMQLGSVTALGQLVAHEEKAMEAAIADGAVMTCVGLLEATESNEVRAAAGLTLSSLTYGQAEKCVALEAGVMRTCAGMLREEDEGLQVAAAAIAMSMCNGTRNDDGTNACKTTAVKEGLVKALAPLLEPEYALELTSEMDDSNSTALPVYVMKAMSSLADAPKGRKQLKAKCLQQLEAIAKSEEPLVKKNALVAIERITWMP